MSRHPDTFTTASLVRQKRIHAALSIGLPPVATGVAIWIIPTPPQPTWLPLLTIGILFYCLGQLGISLGFHRLFSHQSFSARTGLTVVLGVLGSMTAQGPIINWVSDHRRHHSFSDQLGDPHSPHVIPGPDGPIFPNPIRGFWHAQCGWMFGPAITNMVRYSPDLIKDPVVSWLSRRYFVWVGLGFLLPSLAGWGWIGGIHGAFLGFLWGGLVRMFIAYQLTWATNSINHLIGRRPFETGDFSTNLWILGAIDFGEGWHNNHHAFPNSARFGLQWWQIDPAWWVLRALVWLGLASNPVVPTPTQIWRKKRTV